MTPKPILLAAAVLGALCASAAPVPGLDRDSDSCRYLQDVKDKTSDFCGSLQAGDPQHKSLLDEAAAGASRRKTDVEALGRDLNDPAKVKPEDPDPGVRALLAGLNPPATKRTVPAWRPDDKKGAALVEGYALRMEAELRMLNEEMAKAATVDEKKGVKERMASFSGSLGAQTGLIDPGEFKRAAENSRRLGYGDFGPTAVLAETGAKTVPADYPAPGPQTVKAGVVGTLAASPPGQQASFWSKVVDKGRAVTDSVASGIGETVQGAKDMWAVRQARKAEEERLKADAERREREEKDKQDAAARAKEAEDKKDGWDPDRFKNAFGKVGAGIGLVAGGFSGAVGGTLAFGLGTLPGLAVGAAVGGAGGYGAGYVVGSGLDAAANWMHGIFNPITKALEEAAGRR